jgi:hypothetical protein
MSSRDWYNNIGLNDEPTPEHKRLALVRHLSHLQLDALGLANRLQYIGDLRPVGTIDRGVHQMLLGNMEVPGDLVMLVDLLSRQLMRVKRTGKMLKWEEVGDGTYRLQASGFSVRLVPQSGQRYSIHLVHEATGFSPRWPEWRPDLESASTAALVALDDALSYLDKVQTPALAD